MLCEFFLAVELAAVFLSEICEISIAVASDIEESTVSLLLVLIEVSIFKDALESVLIEAALLVPLIGYENLFKMRTYFINVCILAAK